MSNSKEVHPKIAFMQRKLFRAKASLALFACTGVVLVFAAIGAVKARAQIISAAKDNKTSVNQLPLSVATADRQSDLQKQISELKQKIKKNPRDIEAYHLRAFAYLELKQYENAIADFTQIVEITPENADAYRDRGTAYIDLEQFDKALADLARAIKIDPNSYESYVVRSSIYMASKQYENMIADYTRALEIKPSDVWAYQSRADAYRASKQYEKAITDYTYLIKIDAGSTYGYFGRAEVYKAIGEEQKASADLQTANNLFKKRYQPIINELTEQIKSNPRDLAKYSDRAGYYLILEEYEKAIADYTVVAESNSPDKAGAYFNRGNLYFQLKQYEKAIADYTRVIEIKPIALIYACRADACDAIGKTQQAAADREVANKLK